MSMYSLEDKNFIQQFVAQNSLDVFSMENEQKWQELGDIMDRDWEDIREMYRNWKIQDNQAQSAREMENNDRSSEYHHLEFVCEENLSANNVSDNCDIFNYVYIDGRLLDVDQLCYVDAPVTLQPITGQIDSAVQSSSEKRPRDVFEDENNPDLVKILRNKSLKELELKRQEHKEKMMIYKQQLINGAEIHKEKMKILKAKLRAIEEKVENIDNIICNKNLKKKFKSDSV